MSQDSQALLDAAQRMTAALKPADVDHTFVQVTAVALEVLPQVHHASISVQHPGGRLETSAPTSPLACDLDQAQYDFQEGPCYEVATAAFHVVSPDLATDERFPRYAPAAVVSGIRSQVALRLFDGKKAQAGLNLYSHDVGAFDDLGSLVTLFTSQAGLAISYSYEIAHLREALRTRTLIGQAVGMLMERYALTEERAFAFLTRMSQHRNVKLRAVAEELIAASGRPQDPA
jgi:hypothetical protein